MKNLIKAFAFLLIVGIFLIAPVSTQAKDMFVGKYTSWYSEFNGCTKVFISVTGSGAISPSGNLETYNCIDAEENIIIQGFISFAQNQQCPVGNMPTIVDPDGQEVSFACSGGDYLVNKAYRFLSFPLTFEPPPEQ